MASEKPLKLDAVNLILTVCVASEEEVASGAVPENDNEDDSKCTQEGSGVLSALIAWYTVSLFVFVNVSCERDMDNALTGAIRRLSGLEKAPKAGSWSATGRPSIGPASLDTTKMNGIIAGPVESVATRLTSVEPTSPMLGRPKSIRLEPFNVSHFGDVERLYAGVSIDEVNVDSEKLKLKS